jgi:hypothetical protein
MYLSECPSIVASGANSSRKKSRFPPLFLCVLAVSGRFSFRQLSSLSSRHISPPEESRRCKLPCRGVHILRRSLAYSLPSFHPVPLFSVSPELTLAPSRAPHAAVPNLDQADK